MRTSKIIVVLCTIVLVTVVETVLSQQTEKLSAQNLCVSKTTCRDCIQTKSCAWCKEEGFGEKQRCFQPSSTPFSTCKEADTWNPDHEINLKANDELTKARSLSVDKFASVNKSESSNNRGSESAQERIVQISPQRVGLKLRISENSIISGYLYFIFIIVFNYLDQEYHLDVHYSQAADYPVDLYYLMDLSKSMEDDKKKLSSLGDSLTKTMQSMTSKFRLGFGSFVDKVLMPYVSTVPKK